MCLIVILHFLNFNISSQSSPKVNNQFLQASSNMTI